MSQLTKPSATNKATGKAKPREPSKERSTIQVGGAKSRDTHKSKPTVKVKESTPKSTDRTLKSDVNKTEIKTKSKQESIKNSKPQIKSSENLKKLSTTSVRPSPARAGASTTTSKTNLKETQSSSRITRTQYFPSKQLYSNVVQQHLKSKLDKKVESTEEPVISKVKVKPTPSKETPKNRSRDIERPRTATLRKGSIVNSNIAGPDIPKTEPSSLNSIDLSSDVQQGSEDSYEDDFDSYESDFEEYQSSGSASTSSVSSSSSSSLSSDNQNILKEETTTSGDETSLPTDPPKRNTSAGTTDEERMLDSGNFDLPEAKHKQLLDNINESNEKEAFVESSRSNMASLSDEGFEDGKSLQLSNMQFINFADAQKKRKENKNLQKRKKRGEEILSMIRLDHYNFTLIDMAPIPYDDFIKNYGRSNTVQVSLQTGDDDSCEETQTDTIEVANKWTQFPITFSKIDDRNPNYLEIYKKEYLGVGNDDVNTQTSSIISYTDNYRRLEKFLIRVSPTIFTLLEESYSEISDTINQNSKEIPFSKGFLKFNVSLHPLLKNRPVRFVSCYSQTNMKVLTIHGKSAHVEDDDGNELSLKCIICFWNLLDLDEPEKFLTITGEPSCTSCISEAQNLIFCGLSEGSITVWDMNMTKSSVLYEITEKSNKFQEPAYTTAIDYGHSSRVVSVHLLKNVNNNFMDYKFNWQSSNEQICSLDEYGLLIIWGIITKGNQNAVSWSPISLVQNIKLSLTQQNPDLTGLQCTDMSINPLDQNHIFVSTNYGCVVHCLASGTKANPKKYNPKEITQANCIEQCPFSPLYFFVGHENGTIALYSHSLEKPLITVSNKDDTIQNGVQILQWSQHKPCLFYVKDHCNTIHVWDLAISDFFPIYSIPFKEDITCMKLSPSSTNDNDRSYMILTTGNGSVHLHILSVDHGPNIDRYQQDLKNFLKYVSRL